MSAAERGSVDDAVEGRDGSADVSRRRCRRSSCDVPVGAEIGGRASKPFEGSVRPPIRGWGEAADAVGATEGGRGSSGGPRCDSCTGPGSATGAAPWAGGDDDAEPGSGAGKGSSPAAGGPSRPIPACGMRGLCGEEPATVGDTRPRVGELLTDCRGRPASAAAVARPLLVPGARAPEPVDFVCGTVFLAAPRRAARRFLESAAVLLDVFFPGGVLTTETVV
jgi:hypothetical protein